VSQPIIISSQVFDVLGRVEIGITELPIKVILRNMEDNVLVAIGIGEYACEPISRPTAQPFVGLQNY
jgi:hypothetical protein